MIDKFIDKKVEFKRNWATNIWLIYKSKRSTYFFFSNIKKMDWWHKRSVEESWLPYKYWRILTNNDCREKYIKLANTFRFIS